MIVLNIKLKHKRQPFNLQLLLLLFFTSLNLINSVRSQKLKLIGQSSCNAVYWNISGIQPTNCFELEIIVDGSAVYDEIINNSAKNTKSLYFKDVQQNKVYTLALKNCTGDPIKQSSLYTNCTVRYDENHFRANDKHPRSKEFKAVLGIFLFILFALLIGSSILLFVKRDIFGHVNKTSLAQSGSKSSAASLPSLSMLPNDLYNNSSPHGTIPNVPGSISDRLVQKDNLASNQPIPGSDLNLNSIDREFYMLNNMDGAYKHAFVSSENLNESLTKYHAITPYQHSMVKSKLAKSTFINASRISGFDAIVAECPFSYSSLANTLLMLIEEKISFVVDMNIDSSNNFWLPLELGKNYSFAIGASNVNFDLRLKQVRHYTYFDVHRYYLTYLDNDYSFTRLHYRMPTESLETLKIMILIHTVLYVIAQTKSHSQLLIHCSDGSGRSGIFLAVYRALTKSINLLMPPAIYQSSNSESINVTKLVYEMRRSRSEMVRSVQQYRFLYATLNECLKLSNHYFSTLEELKSCHQFLFSQQCRLLKNFKHSQVNANFINGVGELSSNILILPSLFNKNLFAFNYLPESDVDLGDTCQFIWDHNIKILITFCNVSSTNKSIFANETKTEHLNIENKFDLQIEVTNSIGNNIQSRNLTISNSSDYSNSLDIQHYLIKNPSSKSLHNLRSILENKLHDLIVTNSTDQNPVILVQQSTDIEENIGQLFALYFSGIQKLKQQKCFSLLEHFMWSYCHLPPVSMDISTLETLYALFEHYLKSTP